MGGNVSNESQPNFAMSIRRKASLKLQKKKPVESTYKVEESPKPIHKKMTDVVVNDETMNRFLEIQTQIEQYDNMGVFEQLNSAEEEFDIIEKNKQQAEIKYKLLSEQCKKEKQDFENISSPTVQGYFKNKKDHDKAISKEQHEYLQSLNLVEIAQNELNAINQQFKHIEKKLVDYKIENKKAISLYNEQMQILYSTYEGDYGSEYENQLEQEVDKLAEQKEILRIALNKWRNASFLLLYAYNQIVYSEQRWKDLMNGSNVNYPEKVISATEVRNNLVASYQNLLNTKTYLKNVDLPYCTETDLKTLQNLASRTYEDMLSSERQRYCLTIIQILRKRCSSLNQWFEQVITTILVVDYSEMKAEFDVKSKELKLERIRLLHEKINEKTGKKFNLSLFKKEINKKKDECKPNFNSPFIFGNINGLSKSLAEFDVLLTPDELQPMPSKDQILGDAQQIKFQYRKLIANWNQQFNKSKKLMRKTSI